MKIPLKYIQHSDQIEDFPRSFNEIAIVGRSNVGKSSLINALSKSNVARVSKVPGKTRSIHFFEIDQKNTLADLPGYGFAKVSKSLRQSWMGLMESYFLQRKELTHVILLIDCISQITSLDQQMMDFLRQIGVPYVIVVTKMDKLNQKKTHALKQEMKEFEPIFFVSNKKPLNHLVTYFNGLLK